MAVILVRYGELALKSPPVRREFERALSRNILEQFVAAGTSCRLRSDRGHLYVEAEDGRAAMRLLRRVFGVTSVSEVREVATERAAIRAALFEIADTVLVPGARFAVRARRTGQHPFTSQELARDLGGDLLERYADRGLRVDLTHPEVELTVEVRDQRTYLSTGRERGPGGLPLGVAGRVVALVDGPRGALGAFLMMKRGCRCACVISPAGAPAAEEVLSRLDPKGTRRVAGPDPQALEAGVREAAEMGHVDGIVLPLRVEDYPEARARWGDRVVFSPTVGLSDEEVEDRWRGIEELVA